MTNEFAEIVNRLARAKIKVFITDIITEDEKSRFKSN